MTPKRNKNNWFFDAFKGWNISLFQEQVLINLEKGEVEDRHACAMDFLLIVGPFWGGPFGVYVR